MQRTFIIGDEWLYYKLYAGPKTSDMLLTDVIKPVCSQFVSEQLIDKWFFIRYGDPKNHLRWRLHFNDTKNIGHVIGMIFSACQYYIKTGHIHKIQTDTYKREFERYGANLIEFAETLFWQESVMIVEVLDLLEGDEGEKIRWLYSIRAIDQLLDDFIFTTQQKFDLLRTLAENFGKEFNIYSSLIIQLSNKYRKEKQGIFDFMNRNKDNESPYISLFELLNVKSENTSVTISKILDLNSSNSVKIPLNNLLGSYIHMLMNRLFRSKQRLHEMVIYGFLFRYYRTELAREKYSK